MARTMRVSVASLAAGIGIVVSALVAGPDLAAATDVQLAQADGAGGPQAPGMITSQAFKDFSAAAPITVTPYDDNDLNLQLKAEFETELQANERKVAEAETGLLLLFESKIIPVEQAPRRPSLGSVSARSGRGDDPSRQDGSDDVEVDVNVNVWSNTQDSVLGGRQEAQSVGTSVFHINAVLRDQANGEVLWQGDAYYELQSPDAERVARAMVPPLVDNLGKSTANEPFEAR
ncbi:hypothetical protein [Pelagibius sp.]|uniref:hypothetical protein n=1 Tax=Pelagibius sp. TaxID=1931238 RepID=UPI00260B8B75|nr:hypothetical protein [Pelagibius sp.]